MKQRCSIYGVFLFILLILLKEKKGWWRRGPVNRRAMGSKKGATRRPNRAPSGTVEDDESGFTLEDLSISRSASEEYWSSGPLRITKCRSPVCLSVAALRLCLSAGVSVAGHATRLDCMEDMTRWMVEHMAATSGVHVPVFPRQRHDHDPHDPGGHV
ncbi:hypothetical protein E3N88_41915 [Mikania micrantha]|uniref:Uncharacterized protein n=1 Tax=Mikania micrantha TaxID=192012 RepID=A0A5N6LLH9_9ASTR|nr:hypothetical protein E3N88_41915 [Mikania micrantha]